MISNIIQVFLAFFIILICLFIALMVYSYDNKNIVKQSTKKNAVQIFKGIYNYSMYDGQEYTTYTDSSFKFKNIVPSINQSGGAEYSYNFLLKINKDKMGPALTNSNSDIVLFLRGSKIQLNYNNDENCLLKENNKYVLVKNPLIRMKNDGTSIIVEYNTLTSADSYRSDGTDFIDCNKETTDKWTNRNSGLLGIYDIKSNEYNNKWFMFTVVLKELTPENDILNKFKTSCKIYLNGVNMLDRVVEAPYNGISNLTSGSAAMKHNRGPLYLNPGDILNKEGGNNKIFSSESSNVLQMADLTYYNYALTHGEVKNIFKKKFNTTAFSPVTDNTIDTYPIANININNDKNIVKPY